MQVQIPSRKKIIPSNKNILNKQISKQDQSNITSQRTINKQSDKQKKLMKDSQSLFDTQLYENKNYLNQLGNKVQKVYKLESLRNYFKQKEYVNMVRSLAEKKKLKESEVENLKFEKVKDLNDPMKENQKLSNLKTQYEQILNKEEIILAKFDQEYKNLFQTNQNTKQKIKHFWKQLQSTNHLSQINLNQSEFNHKTCQNSYRMNKPKFSETKNYTEMGSIYLTEKSSQNFSIEQKIQSMANSKICLSNLNKNRSKFHSERPKLNSERARQWNINERGKQTKKLIPKSIVSIGQTRKSKRNGRESLQNFTIAVKQIESLENSINLSKKHTKDVKADQFYDIKSKVTTKIQNAKYQIEMTKLLIIYLKNKETMETFIGLNNVHKIINDLQKQIQIKTIKISKVQTALQKLFNQNINCHLNQYNLQNTK